MPRVVAGPCEKPAHERMFGDVCIVHSAIALDAPERFIRLPEFQKIMPKIFAGPWTAARTIRNSLKGALKRDDQI